MKAKYPVIQSLGDSAVIVLWENKMDRSLNRQVHALAALIRESPFEGLVDVVPAYCSLSVLYDPFRIITSQNPSQSAAAFVINYIRSLLKTDLKGKELPQTTKKLPVCYDPELGNDLQLISEYAGVDIDKVIGIHTEESYYVYMAGFLPGFVYMGDVANAIAIPRKQRPANVKAGAVGIAGRQTGIYPVDSPGGWHIAGYTPLKTFDASLESPAMFIPGDVVQFVPITATQFNEIKNETT